ncbi:MAG: hypothetical protein AABX23_04520 [Nanoarchaeota archaeon]
MEIVKQILATVLFLAMAYVAFDVSLLFFIFFILGGIYSLIFHDAWERPGVPILWFAGGLICRVALSGILLPILKYENLIDLVIGLFAFGVVYLIGHRVRNG